ncbi:MAG: hypothetical protein ACMXYG_04810 [Candidatus Woesearchaeota archaeon]
MELVPLIILSIFGVVIIAISVYWILRFMKGKIVLNIPKGNYFFGEKISGNFNVVARSDINVNQIIVSLVCREITRSRNNAMMSSTRRTGSNNTTQSYEIFRSENVVSGATNIPKGTTKSYDFTIGTPADDNNLGAGATNRTLNTVSTLVTGFSRNLQWSVDVKVDSKGVNLTSRRKISLTKGNNPNVMNN